MVRNDRVIGHEYANVGKVEHKGRMEVSLPKAFGSIGCSSGSGCALSISSDVGTEHSVNLQRALLELKGYAAGCK